MQGSDIVRLMRPTSWPLVALLQLAGCAGCGELVVDGDGPAQGETPTDPGEETPNPQPATGAVLLRGPTIAGDSSFAGQSVDVLIEDGRIAAIGALDAGDAETIDLQGRWLAPAFIDSHVHLSYLPRSEQMLDGGVAAAVDLAAPIDSLDEDAAPLILLRSGPMVTALQGYPTQSWGAFGYGLECSDASAVTAAVDALIERGATVIKMPVTESNSLADAALAAGVTAAHAAGLKVASHALTAPLANRAAEAGVDVLAHTPTSTLDAEAVAPWSTRAVISTLRAFGGSAAAVNNLRALREAGATILYGTDFGNVQEAGIIGSELDLLAESGMSGAQILASGTSVPALWWGIEGLGTIEVGNRASLLVLSGDPQQNPQLLATPEQVWIDGVRR